MKIYISRHQKKHAGNVNWRWPELFVKQHVVESATQNSVNLAWLHHVHSAKRHQFLLQGAFVQPMVFVHPSAFSICTAVLDLFRFGSDIAFMCCLFFLGWAVNSSTKNARVTLAYWGDLYIIFISHLQLKGTIFTLRVSSSHRFFLCHDLCKQHANLST